MQGAPSQRTCKTKEEIQSARTAAVPKPAGESPDTPSSSSSLSLSSPLEPASAPEFESAAVFVGRGVVRDKDVSVSVDVTTAVVSASSSASVVGTSVEVVVDVSVEGVEELVNL